MINLGRIEGASIFKCRDEYIQPFDKSLLVPSDKRPLLGDGVLFADGELRAITSLEGDTVQCGEVLTDLRGRDGKYIVSITSGTPSVGSVYTTTPVNIKYSDGSSAAFSVQAKNGSGGGGGGGTPGG